MSGYWEPDQPGAALLEDGSVAAGNSDYDSLPLAVKRIYTFAQWQWLSGNEKAALVQRETEPETYL